MDFREYCKIKEKEILEQLKGFNQKRENLASSSENNINEYGEILENAKDYNKYKLKKKILRFVRPFQEKLQRPIHKTEGKKVPSKREELKEALRQIRLVATNFDGKIFNGTIYPNDKLVEIILEYGQAKNITGNCILKMLISLFCLNTNEKAEVLSSLENNIVSFFDSNYQVLKGTKKSDLLFLFNKLFMFCLSEDEKYSISINEVKNEIKRHYFNENEEENNRKEIEKKLKSSNENEEERKKLEQRLKVLNENGEKRKKLEQRLKVLNELKLYINGDEIVSAPLSLGYFEDLLIISDLPFNVQSCYLEKMRAFISQKEMTESRRILQNTLQKEQMHIIKKARHFMERTDDQAITGVVNRIIKDIVSLCKYRELKLFDTVAQEYNFLDLVEQKLKVLEEMMKSVRIKGKIRPVFSYVTDSSQMPLLVRDIELSDAAYYDEIYQLLKKVAAKGDSGNRIGMFQGIHYYAISGNCVTLLYAKNQKETVIIRAVQGVADIKYSKYLSKNMILMVNKKLNDSKINCAVEGTYEQLVLHALGLEEDEKRIGFGLKKKR